MRRALGHAVEGFLTCAGCGAGPTLEDLGLTLTQDGHSVGARRAWLAVLGLREHVRDAVLGADRKSWKNHKGITV